MVPELDNALQPKIESIRKELVTKSIQNSSLKSLNLRSIRRIGHTAKCYKVNLLYFHGHMQSCDSKHFELGNVDTLFGKIEVDIHLS